MMSGSKEPNFISWDSCVYLGYFKEEADKPLDYLEKIIKDVEAGKITMLVSAVCCSEILNKTDFPEVRSLFRSHLQQEKVIPANVDLRVAEKAADIREAVLASFRLGNLKQGIKAPDAIIAATAVLYQVEVLYSFDPDLVDLSGRSEVFGLKIERPDWPVPDSGLFEDPS